MKTIQRIIVLALVAIFCASNAQADFRWGIKAGLNVNKINYKNLRENISPDNRTGWEAGMMAEFTVPIVNIGMDASILYSRMNLDKETTDINGTDVLLYNHKDFIDIPVNLKWKIGLPVVGSIIKPMLLTGPDFMFAVGKNTLDDIVKTHKCEIGWNFGVGLELFKHLQLQGSYCLGINNIADGAFGLNAENYKAKKNYWTLTAAYLF